MSGLINFAWVYKLCPGAQTCHKGGYYAAHLKKKYIYNIHIHTYIHTCMHAYIHTHTHIFSIVIKKCDLHIYIYIHIYIYVYIPFKPKGFGLHSPWVCLAVWRSQTEVSRIRRECAGKISWLPIPPVFYDLLRVSTRVSSDYKSFQRLSLPGFFCRLIFTRAFIASEDFSWASIHSSMDLITCLIDNNGVLAVCRNPSLKTALSQNCFGL